MKFGDIMKKIRSFTDSPAGGTDLSTPKLRGADIAIRSTSTIEEQITTSEEVASGLRVSFTLLVTNEGDTVATNVVVDNPIPAGTVYAVGSVTGDDTVILLSTDEGVSFHNQKDLYQATDRVFTDIRWKLEDMPPGRSYKLGFQIIVENEEKLGLRSFTVVGIPLQLQPPVASLQVK